MIFVIGYPGTGTRWVSKCLHEILKGEWWEERFPHAANTAQQNGSGLNPAHFEWAIMHLRNIVNGVARNARVVKEEFGSQYCLAFLNQEVHPTVYILRDTLANVSWLMRWVPRGGWKHHFSAICENSPYSKMLCPKTSGLGDPMTELAVAHKLQTWCDLAVCKSAGIPVFRYEDLCANYITEWPRLLRALKVEMPPAFQEFMDKQAGPPPQEFQVDNRMMDVVAEVEETAALYLPEYPMPDSVPWGCVTVNG